MTEKKDQFRSFDDNKPGYLGAFLILLFYLIISVLLVAVVSFVAGFIGIDPESAGYRQLMELLSTLGAFLIVTGFVFKRQNTGYIEILKHRSEILTPKLLFTAALTVFLLKMASGIGWMIFLDLINYQPFEFEKMVLLRNIGMTKNVIGVMMLLAVAPVFEELLFRRIILDGIASRYKPWIALIITSVVFTMFHTSIIALLPILTYALFSGYLYLKTKSVSLCMFVHFIMNFSAWIGSFFTEEQEIIIKTDMIDYILFPLSIVLLVLSMNRMLKMLQNTVENSEPAENIQRSF